MVLFLQLLVVGVSIGAIYALIALGYTMVYGIIELINFAHGDIFMIGTMVAITIFGILGVTNNSVPPAGISLVVIMAVTLLLTMLVCAVPRVLPLLFRPSASPWCLMTSVSSGRAIQPSLSLRSSPVLRITSGQLL